MSERLHIPADRVPDVASAALVSKLTVLRYRRRNGDGTPACRLLRATEAAITKAVRSLPEDKQMEIPLDNSPERKRTRITARNGTVFDLPPEFEPPGNPAPVASIPTPTPAKKVRDAAPKPRRHCITVELDGRTMSVDELAQYEAKS
jgi:hypothetical protein